MLKFPRFVTLIALVAVTAILSPSARAGEISVTVTGIRNDNGNIIACLWLAGWGFPRCDASNTRVITAAVKATTGTVSFRFSDVADGKYAISVGHDQNQDGKLERHKLFGYPLEGAGISNFVDPPKFIPFHHDALFRASGDLTAVTIPLHYP